MSQHDPVASRPRLPFDRNSVNRPPTLKDIASELDLSVAAVSLGLRHSGNISPDTCAKIEAVARRLGYRPNPHAAALSTRASHAKVRDIPLAIIRQPMNPGASRLYPVTSIVAGIEQRAKELGYRTEEFTAHRVSDFPRLLRQLYSRGFEGIFFSPVGKTFDASKLNWSPFCVLSCGRIDQAGPFHTVRTEVFESTRLALEKVRQAGGRRICLALHEHTPPLLDDFARQGAALFFNSHSKKLSCRIYNSKGPINEVDFVGFLKRWEIDSVVGFSVAHYCAIINQGLSVPEDIRFATLHRDETVWGRHISGLLPLEFRCGTIAANRMDTMIRHHDKGTSPHPEQITVSGEWVPGSTLGELSHSE